MSDALFTCLYQKNKRESAQGCCTIRILSMSHWEKDITEKIKVFSLFSLFETENSFHLKKTGERFAYERG